MICCEPGAEEIKAAILTAEKTKHCPAYLYGDGTASEQIVDIIKGAFDKGIEVKKSFYDL